MESGKKNRIDYQFIYLVTTLGPAQFRKKTPSRRIRNIKISERIDFVFNSYARKSKKRKSKKTSVWEYYLDFFCEATLFRVLKDLFVS